MEWIACAERMPELKEASPHKAAESDLVLTFGEYGMDLLTFTRTKYRDGVELGWETEQGDWREAVRVTHWMPLPAPPGAQPTLFCPRCGAPDALEGYTRETLNG